MTGLLFLMILGAFAAIYALMRRVTALEQALRDVEARNISPRETAAPAPRAAAEIVRAAAPERRVDVDVEPEPTAPPPLLREPAHSPPPRKPPEPRAPPAPLNFETLIGGRLPIWIGGIALVLSGFFLVRYSIENGLLGPGARTLLAALFGLALVAASEAARRFPATAEDPRVAQALAGAGVASLYATLYMAAALYHLVAPLPAFFLVGLVTALAMALSLRHGPPTAIMALAGGFLAPLVAGFDAAGIAPLLVYLALFVAALFGLAIHRGWGWLALAASIAGFGWVSFLIAALPDRPGDLAAVAGFAIVLAIGASTAFPATGLANRWLRIAPLAAGLIQLLALAPSLDFGALPWGFYLILSAATLGLAWRDRIYLPGAIAAIVLLLVLEGVALVQLERSVTPLAALAATLLFAIPGHAFARRGTGWPAIALLGTAGPVLVAQACAPSLLGPWQYCGLELLAAASCAHLAWRLRSAEGGTALTAATALAGLLAAAGLAQIVPDPWIALPLVAVMLALAAWARFVRAPALHDLPAFPFAAAILASPLTLTALANLVFVSLSGDRLPYLHIPALGDLVRALLLPTLAALVLLADPQMFRRLRRFVLVSAVTLAILLVYVLAKQPLAIATLDRFVTLGFIERALLTQACLAAGWALLRSKRLPALARVLLALGLLRLFWFDLFLLNPVFIDQAVGGIPLLNAAVLHLGLAAFWFWTLTPRWSRALAAALTIAALLAAVRQSVHGSILTGGITTAENGGYSAALLACALIWLWRGITAAKHDLRVAGLALLTAVTLKVFLIDAAALDGLLRILSFLGLGLALIGIGWAYSRFLGRGAAAAEPG